MPLAPGTTLGPYKILAPLGAGGMGEVYRARDTRLDRDVAIKVLHEDLSASADDLKRLQREAKALAALNHPNIISIYEFDTTNGISFLVTELLNGQTLFADIAKSPQEQHRSLRIAIAVAEGLSAAHSKGVIHRDLKPENIFVTSDGRVKILDFGLARLRPIPAEPEIAPTRSAESEVGLLRGTVPYMSPEQICGMDVDERSDIFAFGCVLYEMLTGRRAFLKNSKAEILGAILHQEPPELSDEIQAPLREIVSRCLQKDRTQRFASAQELLGALKMVSTAQEPMDRQAPRLRHGGRWLVVAILVLLSITATVLWKQKKSAFGSLDKIESIAVLPLQNLSKDSNQQYLVDGMTDELISELSKISALKVISRTSSMQYKEVRQPLPEIARKLDVDALVEGSVLREGDQVRITVQLIHGPSDRHLWTQSYQRKMQGVLAMHSEVAHAIAREIQAKITTQEKGRMSDIPQVNPEAHDAYLKAMYYRAQSKDLPEFQKAFQFIQQAAELDPRDALIQSRLADFYLDFGLWSVLPSSEAYTKANETALRAVELDENLAEAHRILGRVHHYYTWNQIAADVEYRRAIDLKPNDAEIRSEYAWYLCRTGHHEESISEANKALQLDPLSLARIFWVGMTLHYSRHYEKALVQYKKVLELVPDDTQTRYQLARVYLARNQFEDGISEIKKLQALDPSDPLFTPLLGLAYALSGKKGEAKKIIKDLQEKRNRQHVRPYMLAELHTGLGERDRALEWLEKACDERDDWVVFLHVDPNMDPLRSEPRFHALLKRVGLPTTAINSR
ncbi:MAG TPA: protein kinase [Acidobacteriota bacterium]|nr:protein kinase [Acidobacteriota bacterium]